MRPSPCVSLLPVRARIDVEQSCACVRMHDEYVSYYLFVYHHTGNQLPNIIKLPSSNVDIHIYMHNQIYHHVCTIIILLYMSIIEAHQ